MLSCTFNIHFQSDIPILTITQKLSYHDYISLHIANFLFQLNWARRIKNDLPCFCTHYPTRNRSWLYIYYITFSNYTITLFMVTLTLDFSFSFIFMTIILSLHKHLVKVSTLKRYILYHQGTQIIYEGVAR